MSKRPYRWIVVAAGLAAALMARPYAGAWNDGSRFAAIESIVDRHTWCIDESIYVVVPKDGPAPYTPGDELLATFGTKDKLRIDGKYYSDKSPVPAVLMACPYQVWRWLGLPSAAERPDPFARLLNVLFGAGPYVFAVWALTRIVRFVGVPGRWGIALVASFAISLALPYAAHANNHILLLAIAAGICEVATRPGPTRPGRAAYLGALAGLGYATDLGAGPPLLLAMFWLVLWKTFRDLPPLTDPESGEPDRRTWNALAYALAALPFVVGNHALNYAIGGTFTPANANAEYLDWPGSPFTGKERTGGWHHQSLGLAGLYALDLLFGKKGILLYAPPLLLVLFGMWRLTRKRPERPILVAMAVWVLAAWLLYAATSRNLSGACLSIRWFVPFLAPGYLALAVLLRDYPRWRTDFAILAIGGALMVPEFDWRGPWSGKMPITFWPAIGLTLLVWGIVAGRRFLRPS